MFGRRDGIVLGGAFDHGNWSTTPDPDVTARILKARADFSRRCGGKAAMRRLLTMRASSGLGYFLALQDRVEKSYAASIRRRSANGICEKYSSSALCSAPPRATA